VKATAGERIEFTSLTCSAIVLYLRLAEQTLVSRSTKQEEKLARRTFRLEGLGWIVTYPRLLLLGRDICRAEDGMDFMLSQCTGTLEECLSLVQQAKSGRVGVDLKLNVLMTGRSSSWAEHARDFCTLVIYDIISHMNGGVASRLQCIRGLRVALTKPPLSTRRSWPAKKTFLEVKANWSQLNVGERIFMTTLSNSEYWFIQACDVAVATVTKVELSKQIFNVEEQLLEKLRERFKLLASLDVRVAPVARIELTPEYVMNSSCLDELYKKSVWHTPEKERLVRTALCFRYESLFLKGVPAIVAHSSSTWADVERVVATLLLECILQRYALVKEAGEFQRQHDEATTLSSVEASRKKHAKTKVKRQARVREAALLQGEREERLAEVAKQEAQEMRLASERDRLKAEETRRDHQDEARSQEEVERKLCEERCAAQRKDEIDEFILLSYKEASRKRREKVKVKRHARVREAALNKAKREEQFAEVAWLASERDRLKAEETRRAQAEARFQAEVEMELYKERCAAQRKEVRLSTLALLAQAPSWDISCLRVSRTFIVCDDGYRPRVTWAVDW